MKNTNLKKLIARVPKFMHPDYSLIGSISDLEFQLAHEIDLAEEGDLTWTSRQLKRAKMFAANVRIEILSHPEQYDSCNEA